jgi:hypothetical protein
MMPITAIYSRQFVNAARTSENLTVAQAKKVLAEAPAGWLKTLSDYINDAAFVDGAIDLTDLRAKFPTIIPADDAAAYFLLRIAVGEAGGMAV